MIFRRLRRAPRVPCEPGTPVIRAVRRGDLKAMQAITAAAFDGVSTEQNVERQFGRLAGTTWQDRRAAYVARDVKYWPHSAFVAELDGELVGYVTTATDRHARTGHIRNLAVDPAHQSKGIGRSLIHHALSFFRAAGMRYARIEALEQNERCTRLYRGLGFAEVGRQVLYFRKLD